MVCDGAVSEAGGSESSTTESTRRADRVAKVLVVGDLPEDAPMGEGEGRAIAHHARRQKRQQQGRGDGMPALPKCSKPHGSTGKTPRALQRFSSLTRTT
mmetsp:Transcript_16316/g.49859  ORF Transcript_16316/g.49859 Transcript_16316/m.49859 type:complete len:99 (-) Transcript_16316:281-577(-)